MRLRQKSPDMGDPNGEKKQKGPKLGRKPNGEDLGSLLGEGITGKLPRSCNRVTLKVFCNIYAISSHFILFFEFQVLMLLKMGVEKSI